VKKVSWPANRELILNCFNLQVAKLLGCATYLHVHRQTDEHLHAECAYSIHNIYLIQEEKDMIEKIISRDDVDTLESLFRKNNIDVNADLGVSVPSLLCAVVRICVFHNQTIMQLHS